MMNLFYPDRSFPVYRLAGERSRDRREGGPPGSDAEHAGAPKIFYTNGAYEYWGRAASLIHTTADGKQDAPLPPDTRIYFLAGTQHGAGCGPGDESHAESLNPADYRWTMRALLASMNAWVKDGVEPPESQYPRIDRDQLVPDEHGCSSRRCPGVRTSHERCITPIISTSQAGAAENWQAVSAVGAASGSRTATRSPASACRIFACRCDLHRLESARRGIGAPDMLYSMAGSFIPFARTKAEREKTATIPGRPSKSAIQSKREYLEKVTDAAAELVRQRFLLDGRYPESLTRRRPHVGTCHEIDATLE